VSRLATTRSGSPIAIPGASGVPQLPITPSCRLLNDEIRPGDGMCTYVEPQLPIRVAESVSKMPGNTVLDKCFVACYEQEWRNVNLILPI
jgi:hypothetical protein